VQTFYTDTTYEGTAKVLDYQRLGKQRVEAKQILTALVFGTGWVNHPATKMWRGAELGLCHYGIVMCEEYSRRGYGKESVLQEYFENMATRFTPEDNDEPVWADDEVLILSHRSGLVRKNPEIYAPIWPDVPDDLEYAWPKLDRFGGYELSLSIAGKRRVDEGLRRSPLEIGL